MKVEYLKSPLVQGDFGDMAVLIRKLRGNAPVPAKPMETSTVAVSAAAVAGAADKANEVLFSFVHISMLYARTHFHYSCHAVCSHMLFQTRRLLVALGSRLLKLSWELWSQRQARSTPVLAKPRGRKTMIIEGRKVGPPARPLLVNPI
jgi:hypothetical protein